MRHFYQSLTTVCSCILSHSSVLGLVRDKKQISHKNEIVVVINHRRLNKDNSASTCCTLSKGRRKGFPFYLGFAAQCQHPQKCLVLVLCYTKLRLRSNTAERGQLQCSCFYICWQMKLTWLHIDASCCSSLDTFRLRKLFR